MKEQSILISKASSNLVIAITYSFIRSKEYLSNTLLYIPAMLNIFLLVYRYYVTEFLHNTTNLFRVSIAIFGLEIILIVLIYAIKQNFWGIFHFLLILFGNYLYFYARKKEIKQPNKLINEDLGKCISQYIHNNKLILYAGEIVTIIEKFESTVHIRKQNGDDYIVSSEYVVDYNGN